MILSAIFSALKWFIKNLVLAALLLAAMFAFMVFYAWCERQSLGVSLSVIALMIVFLVWQPVPAKKGARYERRVH